MKILTCFALAATLAGSLLSMNAPAAEAKFDLRERVVKFGDLDLTQSRGVEALYLRIRSAARDVCAPYSTLQLSAVSSTRICVQESIARAIVFVDSPKLTTYYHERFGVSGEKPTRLAETAGARRE